MESEAPCIRLVAGLGNPGADYARTRHNIGFMVLDHFAAQLQLRWEHSAKWDAFHAKADRVLLMKPASFMNRSGRPIAAVAEFYKIPPEEILIVLDDLALPLGRLRIRMEGGSGGHHGLESIFVHFGTDAIPRLRIGIGAAPREGAVDYVLGSFFEEEKSAVEKTIQRAVEAVKCTIDKGVLSAMNTFNQAAEP